MMDEKVKECIILSLGNDVFSKTGLNESNEADCLKLIIYACAANFVYDSRNNDELSKVLKDAYKKSLPRKQESI